MLVGEVSFKVSWVTWSFIKNMVVVLVPAVDVVVVAVVVVVVEVLVMEMAAVSSSIDIPLAARSAHAWRSFG